LDLRKSLGLGLETEVLVLILTISLENFDQDFLLIRAVNISVLDIKPNNYFIMFTRTLCNE